MQQSLRSVDPKGQTQYPGAVPHEFEDDEIDLFQIARTIWAGKWIIAVSALFCVVLAFFYVSGLEPEYRASAKVMFNLDKKNITNIEDVVVSGGVNNDELANEMEVLRSTALIERVIEDLNLASNPNFNPRLRVNEPTLVDRWLSWLTLPPEVTSFLQGIGVLEAEAPAPDPLVEARRERLTIIGNVLDGLQLNPIRNSTVIEIVYISNNPNTSERIANAIADQYIIEQLEGKLDATRSATEWLSERVQELEQKVETAEGAVAAARTRLAAAAGQTIEVTQAQLTEVNTSLSAARAEAAALDAQLDRLTEALNEGTDVGSVPEFRQAPLISSFRTQESELVSRRVELRASVGEDHPSLTRLNAQLDDLRRKMREEAGRVVESVRVERDSARALATQLAANVRELEEKALAQSADEIELRQLEREAQASRLLYENFLGRLQETSQQESLQSADARVITPAEIPNFPQTSKEKRILAVAGVLGLLIGVGIVLLLQRLNNTFRGPQQVEDETGLTVLASVPTVGRRMHRRDVIEHFRKKPNSSLAEAIRNLRTSILFSDVDNPPRAVMFTSSVPREGKSTTATLVALTSQQMGRSAILVDCDFRLPALSRILQFDEDKPGILSLMNGTAEFDDAVSTEPESGLHVLMARQSETKTQMNPADILASQRFRSLIETLKRNYDLVILDSPPALVVSDARILSKAVDAVVYTIRWDDTARGAAVEGLKELRSVGAPVIGAVLSMVNESKAAKYAYQGYGYGYYRGRYKDYYVD